MKKIIIIGAGAIGLHTAYYLRKAGHEVEVLEASGESDQTGCSYGNCGYMVPSHFITMASPGMLHSGLKMMLNSKSPVGFNPAKNIGRLGWFLKFTAAATNSKKVENAIPTLYTLNHLSNQLYQELKNEHQWGNEYQSSGLFMMAATDKGMEEEIHIAKIANELGIHTETLDAAKLGEIEPNVTFDVKGAILYKSDAFLNPAKHMAGLKSWLNENGVKIHYYKSVSKFELYNKRISKVYCGSTIFAADEFVIATGANTFQLGKLLNINIPVIAGKGYSIDFKQEELPLKRPLILVEDKVALSPYNDFTRLGSGMEFNGHVGKYNYTRIQSILDSTRKRIPTFGQQNAKELNIWEGQRPLTPDGVPLIGNTRKYKNIYIAAGHAMMGMSLAPITGKIIADKVSGVKEIFDSPLLSPDRYL